MADFLIFDWKKEELGFAAAVLVMILGISLLQLRTGQLKTRDAQRKADAELVGRALNAYWSDHNIFPLPATGSGEIVSCGRNGQDICPWGGSKLVDEDNVVYLEKLPVDPLSGQGRKYWYQVSDDRQHYKILVALERSRDPAFKKGLTVECGTGIQCNWYVEK